MLFCAACQSKSCAARMDQTQTFPKGCPGQGEKMDAWLQEYDEPLDRLMAQKSALCSPDHSECRLAKTMRFAKECGFHKLGLAFCDTLDEQGRQIDAILRRNGFQVESVRCKVGHIDRCTIGVPSAQKAMRNPIAQAELLNAVVVGIVMLLSASGNARILSLFGMSVGTSVAVINYISRIFAPIESLGMEIQTIQSAMAGVRRIDAFLAQPERAMENGETAAYGDVVLSHVTFGYGEAPVLRDFSMTVKQGEQITLGDPQITEEMAKHAARLAGIDAAVQALPEGYHTVCTEGLFSQGEWQLLSIARAAAANPAVLLLDGITANLDAETEQRVLAALRRACEGRTVLSVSHRIYENLGGRTIEIGSQRNAALSHV